MRHTFWLIILFFGIVWPVAAQNDVSSAFADPQGAAKSNSQEETLYVSANDALNNGNYDQAVTGFEQVARLKGRRADGALYWKAYALNKSQRRTEALAAVAQLRNEYPRSSYISQAKVLEMDIRPQNPESVSDEDLKPYAVDALMYSDPEKALPILEKLLQGNSSPRVKERALFVLAQNQSPKAQEVLLSIAKGNSLPELQSRAIQWLAMRSGRNKAILPEIYASATDVKVKRQVLRSFLMDGDKEGLLSILRKEKDPDLLREGIRQLGPMRATPELRQLYKERGDAETKEAVLQALGVSGAAQDLIEIAKTETDPDLRSRAIRNVGVFGGEAAAAALTSIYSSNADLETKKEIIRALSIHRAAKEMVALARKETNPELKKELVRNLSFMRSPEANDYMLEILNK